jgi:hypothetical protein
MHMHNSVQECWMCTGAAVVQAVQTVHMLSTVPTARKQHTSGATRNPNGSLSMLFQGTCCCCCCCCWAASLSFFLPMMSRSQRLD